MSRRRGRQEEGLIVLALKSDWKFAALLALGCFVGGVVVFPRFMAGNMFLAALVPMARGMGWIGVFAFAAIAVLRWIQKSAVMPVAQVIPLRPQAWSLDVLARIEWRRYEDLCCAFYREMGVRAETTHLGADGGVDVHLFQDEAQPARATDIVQCKAWNKPVGVREIREMRGVMAHEKVEGGYFMAPMGFTDEARAFARENRITLLDGPLFLAMIEQLPAATGQRLLAFATEGDWTTPSCPSCGEKMVSRKKKSNNSAFWGCPAYPRCRGMLPMRAGVVP